MKHLRKTMLAAGVLALGASACFSDPTSSLRNGPARLNLSVSFAVLNIGDSVPVTIEVLDEQGNQYPFSAPTFTSGDAAVATAALQTDTVKNHLPNNSFWRAYIKAAGAGQAAVQIAAGGVTDSVIVAVFPPNFTGTVAPASVSEGGVVTISSTALVGFDPNNTTVSIGAGDMQLQSVTANQIQFQAWGVGAGQTVTLGNVLLLGSIPIPSLEATATVTVTNPDEPGNNAPGAGRAITLPANVGDSVVVDLQSVSGSDADDFFTITTTTADSVDVVLRWTDTGSDLDLYLTDAGFNNCLPASCPGATGADPEHDRARLAAATTYLIWVNFFAAGTYPVTPYKLVIYKRG